MNVNLAFLFLFGLVVILGLLEVMFFVKLRKQVVNCTASYGKERQFLDKERAQVTRTMETVQSLVQEARTVAEEMTHKLQLMGVDADEQWKEVKGQLLQQWDEIREELSLAYQEGLDQNTAMKNSLTKVCLEAQTLQDELGKKIKDTKTLLKLFDSSTSVETLLKEIRAEKFQDAKKQLEMGLRASDISKNTGLTLSEVMFVQNMVQS